MSNHIIKNYGGVQKPKEEALATALKCLGCQCSNIASLKHLSFPDSFRTVTTILRKRSEYETMNGGTGTPFSRSA